MNEISTTQPTTMTSREIAELVDKRHDNVKRTIETLVDQRVIDTPQTVGYLDAVGRGGQTEYKLDKRSSIIVVAQLSPEFTARIVDRWQELEEKAQKQAPTIAHVDPNRVIYLGQRYALTTAGFYYAIIEARVMGAEHVARKYGMHLATAQGLLRFKPEHLMEWEAKTRDGSSLESLPQRAEDVRVQKAAKLERLGAGAPKRLR